MKNDFSFWIGLLTPGASALWTLDKNFWHSETFTKREGDPSAVQWDSYYHLRHQELDRAGAYCASEPVHIGLKTSNCDIPNVFDNSNMPFRP